MNRETYKIREVKKSDLPELAAIEQQRWTREKTAILPIETLEEWYQTRSPFFLVAEKNGVIAGFYYGMQVHFSLEHLEEFTSANALTDCGYTIHTHNKNGESVYGVNIVTIAPDAGTQLNAEVHRRIRNMNAKYFLGFTRLVHLDYYLRSIEAQNGGNLPYAEGEIALWYAYQTMKMIGARTWEEGAKEPYLALPKVKRPDTVLKFHAEGTTSGLLSVVPNYMEDPKSRNYGAFLASEQPHVVTAH